VGEISGARGREPKKVWGIQENLLTLKKLIFSDYVEFSAT
jgi:hypothetical protein